MKQCTKCGMEKVETDFALNRYGDKTYRRNVCRDCYNAAKQNHEDDEKPDGLICRKCGEYKPIAAFPRQRQCSYGVEPICKTCKVKRRQVFVALYPERARSVGLKARYGITLEDYEAMFARQGGCCVICGESGHKLVVDHNHETGKVRALLCHHCNTMIGSARRYQHPCERRRLFVCRAACCVETATCRDHL